MEILKGFFTDVRLRKPTLKSGAEFTNPQDNQVVAESEGGLDNYLHK